MFRKLTVLGIILILVVMMFSVYIHISKISFAGSSLYNGGEYLQIGSYLKLGIDNPIVSEIATIEIGNDEFMLKQALYDYLWMVLSLFGATLFIFALLEKTYHRIAIAGSVGLLILTALIGEVVSLMLIENTKTIIMISYSVLEILILWLLFWLYLRTNDSRRT